jgi:DNA-directed RNA polymerase specialized sigma24 family protein
MFLRRKQPHAASDAELVTALCDGHRSALGHLWDRYAQLLYGVGMKYLKDPDRSKDMVVELFTALPELLGKKPVERFRPWVHTVMRKPLPDAVAQRPPDPKHRARAAGGGSG